MSSHSNKTLHDYYNSLESRVGYKLLLGGTRHFGFYKPGTFWPFPIGKALRAMEDEIAKILAPAPKSKLLDAGCGVGHVAIHLAKKGHYVQAIDITDRHLAKAQRNIGSQGLSDNITITKCDYHDLSIFEDRSYDGVYTMETFVHSTSPETAAIEFFRVLKPGGTLAMFEYDHVDFSSQSEAVTQSWKFINNGASMPACNRFERGVLQDVLRNAGFENIKVKDLSVNVVPMLRMFYMMAIVPYIVVSLLGVKHKFVNTVAAYEGYLHRDAVRYIAVSATKPSK